MNQQHKKAIEGMKAALMTLEEAQATDAKSNPLNLIQVNNPSDEVYERLFGNVDALKMELKTLGDDYLAVQAREACIRETCQQKGISLHGLTYSKPKQQMLLESQRLKVVEAGRVFLVDGEPELKTGEQRHAALVYRLVGNVWLTNYNFMLDRVDKDLGRKRGMRGFTSRPQAVLEA